MGSKNLQVESDLGLKTKHHHHLCSGRGLSLEPLKNTLISMRLLPRNSRICKKNMLFHIASCYIRSISNCHFYSLRLSVNPQIYWFMKKLVLWIMDQKNDDFIYRNKSTWLPPFLLKLSKLESKLYSIILYINNAILLHLPLTSPFSSLIPPSGTRPHPPSWTLTFVFTFPMYTWL